MVFVLRKGATKKEIEELNKQLAQIRPRKAMDAHKYCGTIKLKEDPLVVQKRIRE